MPRPARPPSTASSWLQRGSPSCGDTNVSAAATDSTTAITSAQYPMPLVIDSSNPPDDSSSVKRCTNSSSNVVIPARPVVMPAAIAAPTGLPVRPRAAASSAAAAGTTHTQMPLLSPSARLPDEPPDASRGK